MSLLLNLLFFITPLLFSSSNSELFELPKTYFVYVITILMVFFHFRNFLSGKKPLYFKSILTFPLILFFVSQTVSTIFSIDSHTSFFGYYSRLNGGLLSLIAYILLALIIPLYFDARYLISILISGLIVAFYGILQHFGIDKNMWVQDVQSRVFSTLGQPNWLAAYLCILLPFTINGFLNTKNLFDKSFFLLLTSSFYLSLLFTKSKSGLIAALISLGIYFIFHLKNNLTYFVISLLILLSITINNPIKDKIIPVPILNTSFVIDNSLNITPSEDIRKIVWQGSLKLWQQYPLFGTGPETFGYAYYWTRPASHNLTSEWDFLYNKAHNEYLNYLASSGLFGFVSYLVLIIYSLIAIIRSKNIAILAAYISILITNFFGFSVVVTSIFFFLLPQLSQPNDQVSLPKKFPKIIILGISIFLISKVLAFFIADLAYAQSENQENKTNYLSALDFIKISVNLRHNEPVYLIKQGEITAKLALTQKSKDYANLSISSTEKALKISPYNLNFWKQRAQIYYYLSGLDTQYYLVALESLHQAAKLAPTDAKTFYMLGEFYKNIKEIDTAQIYYQKALDLKPNYDHAAFALGEIYLGQKKKDEAKKMFQLVLSIAPKNQDAIKYLQSL